MLGISLDPRNTVTLVDQLVAAIRQRIDDRMLRPGMRLPPIRQMAIGLGVSRFTVVESYDRLVAIGLVVSRRGAGFYVAGATSAPIRPAEDPLVERTIERAFDNADVMRDALAEDSDHLKVGVGWLPPGWLDEAGLRRRLRVLTGCDALHLSAYGAPQGYAPLRAQLTVRLEVLGIAAPAEQIVLTSGATQALDLVARMVLRPGDCVLVDDPGYWNLFAALRLLGVRLVGVPRRVDGPDLSVLESLLVEHRPKVFITHSVLHNPTSCNLSMPVAHRLLHLAAQHDLLIVEDDTYGDFQTVPTARLASLDGLDRVIYVGSFSKTLSPNLRVGFLAARPDLVRRLTDAKLFTSVGSSEFAEQIICEMLIGGHYRKFMARLRERLDAAADRALRLLERTGFAPYAVPSGGMFIWAARPGEPDATPLVRRGAGEGIVLAPGQLFRPQLQASPYLRFNVAYMDDPRLARLLEAASA